MEASDKKYFLCIHGYCESSVSFSKRIKPVTDMLNESYAIDSLVPTGTVLLNEGEAIPEEEKLYGWLYLEEPKLTPMVRVKEILAANETYDFPGYPISQSAIETLVSTHPNITGILAFSQGTLFTLMLLIQACERKLKVDLLKNFKCIILFCGLGRPIPKNEGFEVAREYAEGKKQVEVPTLLVFGKKDETVTNGQTEALKRYFRNFEVWEHEGRHNVSTKKEDLDAYGKFFDRYLKG